ncbi:ATP-binding cassette domain-containing protein [Paracrocinitomix mangrovi]|uniref:ABC transporter ATP-binding protein n=1 Tax=Paracrocinitomix mangrovi TaxID=2862509 RepID=UPI001C8E9588|nr:ATP-binding cassette domain-containing protein [Paracrocinitomix mangrovi]UKN01254.1 ATP-binding cassette domain-containing protein [Paracrocinitomix mangrovi]
MEMLKVENIVKQYSGHRALDDISITTKRGEIFGLLGPNGAGKTSLIRIINQITGPDNGRVLLEGREIKRSDIEHIGYLPEERGLYKKMKVKEQVMYFARLKGLSKSEAKERMDYWFEKFDITSWYDKKVEELSKGMAQKIQFIITVIHEPKLLILDEPFSGFDPINTQLIKNEILELKKNGASIMLSTHNMNSVEEICDSIALINKSKLVVAGALKDVKNEFKSNIYAIQFKGMMMAFANALFAGYSLEHSEQLDEDTAVAHVKLLKDNTLNDLLKTVMPVVKIEAVNEVVPSMNDIFIEAVTGKKKENEFMKDKPNTEEGGSHE